MKDPKFSCKYLWVSRVVTITFYFLVALVLLIIVDILLDNILLSDFNSYIILGIIPVYLVCEIYSKDFFERHGIKHDSEINKSFIVYREHKKICRK